MRLIVCGAASFVLGAALLAPIDARLDAQVSSAAALHRHGVQFDALELAAIDRDVAGDAPSACLVVERRFRFDNLPRGGILNIRGRAVNGLRDPLIADLRRERAALHSAAD